MIILTIKTRFAALQTTFGEVTCKNIIATLNVFLTNGVLNRTLRVQLVADQRTAYKNGEFLLYTFNKTCHENQSRLSRKNCVYDNTKVK